MALSIYTNFSAAAYFLTFIEVLIHQLLAEFFMGGLTAFHFFIWLVGILPILTFKKRLKLAVTYGIITSLLFIILESISPSIQPKVPEISSTLITVIRIVNISLSATLILVGLLIFAYIVWNIEQNLQIQVHKKTKEIQNKNKKIYKMQNHIILSLSSLVENRDTDTGEHIQRTSAYVDLIARKAYEMGLYSETITPHFIELIKTAAPMHDIGKIVVSDSILKKPGKLTSEEYELMKQHTIAGGKIIYEVLEISDNKEYIKIAHDVALYHHEHWDGTGYPEQLSGESIPVCARIMAIADVFDALVSKRCYKLPMPLDTAFQFIQDNAGKHFDPILTEVFIKNRQEVLNILTTYKE
ncbi:MAG: HD domain-containing protein [Treponema sp.]|nr:HD domain-containing protein [Treponema sp.]